MPVLSLHNFLVGILFLSSGLSAEEKRPPNVVIILCDNLGNGDIACFNPQTKHRTPRLDQMAAEGRRLTSFYSASGVCTPSRASLMTGCYPRRIGLHVSAIGASVLQPVAARGLNPDEETIAELLKSAGYVTACIGKWHLGDQPTFLPTRHGFDSFFGIPYSEDMIGGKKDGWPELPLLRNERVIEAPVDVQHITRRLTEEAIGFIRQHKDQPFFLYFPEAGPGSRKEPYPGPAFQGKSANGLYGDAIEELDWSAGEILDTLREQDLEKNTLVIWTSDNGAVKRTPQQGSNAPYKGSGYTTSEGGQRMPCIVRWPSKVLAGSISDEVCTLMDLLPTVANICRTKRPELAIDGHDIESILFDQTPTASPYDEAGFFYYHITQLQAVRAGPWKLYLSIDKKKGLNADAESTRQDLALYDVRNDVGEAHEVASQHPEVVQKLTLMAERARFKIGDLDAPGSEQREPGLVKSPLPLLLPP